MFKSFGIRGIAAGFAALVAIMGSPAAATDLQPVPQLISAPAVQFLPTLTIPAPMPAAQPPFRRPPRPSPFASPRPAAFLPILRPAAPADVTVKRRRSLRDLVISFVDFGSRSQQEECLAAAVFFEARGETLEGQLAVAEVVLNRAASGIYPPAICDVVTQRSQFSFIRRGKFPPIDRSSQNWRKALAIAEIARKDLAEQVAPNVLWFHAHYVAPAWKRTRTRVARIGSHIFYS
jgi:hypothetical protein